MIHALTNHSREIRYEAEKLKDIVLSGNFIDSAEQRVQESGITIDKASSKDLDDGIWAEKNKDGYSIYVSISDVTEYIELGSPLDLDARKRASSVYLNFHTYHMFPSEISTDILSLNDQTNRKTMTMKIDMDNDFNVINTDRYESIFFNKKRFNHESFEEQYLDKNSQYHKTLRLFEKIADGLFKKRLSRGAKNDYHENVELKLSETYNGKSISSFIVQEFMILHNIEAAKTSYKEKINSIFRIHMPNEKESIIPVKSFKNAFYSHKPGYHYGLGESFYTYSTSPIRRYGDTIEHRQNKNQIRGIEGPFNINEIRNLTIELNNTVNHIIHFQKAHYIEVSEKRVKRFIKKLEYDNYNSIGAVIPQKFSQLISYFTTHPTYLNIPAIQEEILYRISSGLLSDKDLGRLISIPKDVFWINLIRQEIESKKVVNN